MVCKRERLRYDMRGKGVQQLKEQLHQIRRFVVKFYSLPQSEVLNGGERILKGYYRVLALSHPTSAVL